MANDGGKGFDVHAIIQGVGGESMAKIVEVDLLALGVFQNKVGLSANIRWVDGMSSFTDTNFQ